VTAATKVFCARLAGLPVFDPIGDAVGALRDIVVALRVGRDAPRVLGLVVQVVQQRRRIFVPITHVGQFDASAVILNTAKLNLRPFEQRPGETLVLGELLDRQVTRLEDGLTVEVVDVAMVQQRNRDWLVQRVAVREPGRGLRARRGHLSELEWDEVSGFALPEQGQGAANLLAAMEKLRPADLADVLNNLPEKRRQEVASALDDERLADVLEELPEEDQAEIIRGLETERAADVIEAMSPDDAADLLAELPAEYAERLLAEMAPGDADPLRRLLTYEEDTAGGLMTTDPVVLPPNATVAEALARVRQPDLSPALAAQVYVCRPPTETPTGTYIGTAHFQRLLREPPSSLVGGIAEADPEPLSADASLRDVTRHLATYDLVAAPVVDADAHLLGAVTVDDVLDHLLPDDWREGRPSRPTSRRVGVTRGTRPAGGLR
jgi:flagellar motility protein MotE (MotC chaperone)